VTDDHVFPSKQGPINADDLQKNMEIHDGFAWKRVISADKCFMVERKPAVVHLNLEPSVDWNVWVLGWLLPRSGRGRLKIEAAIASHCSDPFGSSKRSHVGSPHANCSICPFPESAPNGALPNSVASSSNAQGHLPDPAGKVTLPLSEELVSDDGQQLDCNGTVQWHLRRQLGFCLQIKGNDLNERAARMRQVRSDSALLSL